jgi:hypothetical protein
MTCRGNSIVMADSENKFDINGNAKDYQGNTIISFLNSELYDIYREGVLVREAFMKSEISKSFAFLPPSSFHVTILQLCREIDRGTSIWPKIFSPSEPFSNIDEKLKRIVDEIPKPHGVKVEVDQCFPVYIRLKTSSEEDERKIRTYREEVSRATGIKHPGHNEYAFHMTFSYKISELTLKEEALEKDLCDKYTEILKNNIAPFELPVPEFVIFNNMLSYETNLNLRKLV